jgi:hypothetical protein
MTSHGPFEHLQYKLWSKEGPGVKLAVWLPSTKSGELTRSWCVQMECDTPLESKFASDLIPIRGLSRELWVPKVTGVQTETVSGLLLGSPRNKKSFGCGCGGVTQRILHGGRWWLPPSSGRGESTESVLPVACPNTKGVSEGELSFLWLVLDVRPSN